MKTYQFALVFVGLCIGNVIANRSTALEWSFAQGAAVFMCWVNHRIFCDKRAAQ